MSKNNDSGADNVVPFTGITNKDIPTDAVLAGPVGELRVAIVLGVTHEGNFYFSSSCADGGEVLWWMEKARYRLMQISDELETGKDTGEDTDGEGV